MKVNEERISIQVEEIVDEAYQVLYIEKMDDLELNESTLTENILSIKDGEIYRLTYRKVMAILNKYIGKWFLPTHFLFLSYFDFQI